MKRRIFQNLILISLSAGLLLGWNATAYGACYGNEFLVTAREKFDLNTSTNDRASIRFVVTESGNPTLETVYVHVYDEGTIATTTLRVETNGVGDKPSGTLAYTGPPESTGTFTTTGSFAWRTVNVGDGTLTTGETYHLVFVPSVASGTDYLRVGYTTPKNDVWIPEGEKTANSNRGFLTSDNAGSTWTDQSENWEGLYVLEYSGPAYEGDPYTKAGTAAIDHVSGNDYFGMDVTMSAEKSVDKISIYTQTQAALDPDDHLTYSIYDVTDGALDREGILVAKTEVLTSYKWFTADLSSALTLTNGHNYSIYVLSPGSNTTNDYYIYKSGTDDTVHHKACTWGGASNCLIESTDGGTNWTPDDTRDLVLPLTLAAGAEVTVTKTDVPILSLQAGEANQTVFAATISGDSGGDFLNSFIFMNSGGTMQDTLDIDAAELWKDNNGDHKYDGSDTLIDTLAWDGTDSWDNTNTELNYTVPAEGLDIVVTIDVSVSPTDGRTFTGQIPANGISMATATDGPASASTNANTQEVNTQVSTSELNKQDALAAHVCADDDNKLALTFDIPDDGGLADTLTAIKVYNAETTNPMDNTDIEFLKVWEDVDGDDTFDTVADTPHTLTWNTDPDHWEASGLTISIPAGGKTFFVSIDITSSPTVGNKFQAKLPLATAITLSSTINTLEADCINNNAQTVVVNTWETLTPPALGVGDNNGHRIEAMSGYVYMWVAYGAADGESCSESTAFYQYDPDGGSWDDNWNVSYNETAPIDSSYGIDIVSAKDTSGNPAIYILGGTTTDESEQFYRWTESDGWSIALADITWNASVGQKKPRNGSTLVWDGDDIIYYFPGSGYDYSQQDWYRYTISTNTWAEIGSASLPVIQGPGNAATKVTIDSNDYIFVYLGEITSPYTGAAFYKYGPLPSGSWTELTGHPYGCDDGSDLVWDGGDYIYHSPGCWAESYDMPEPNSPNESRLLRYSISGDSWTEMHEQPIDVSANGGSDDGGASALIGGYIYRLKGGDGNGGTASTDFFRYLDLLPTVSTYSPEDDATGVAIDANLVLTFSETVVKGTGNIVIKKTADNTEFETIPVGDARVEVADATVTINPTGTFANSTGYYVQIAATCFDNGAGNSYTGIADTTIWNFTTAAGVSAPTVTTDDASSVEKTEAQGNGEITGLGGAASCDERGFDWDVDSGTPYANNWTETDSYGTGTFTHGLTSLTKGELYYYRAKAHNSAGWGYGSEKTFLTKPDPLITDSFSATTISSTQINLSWTNGTGGDGGYIEHHTEEDLTWEPGDHNKIDTDGYVTTPHSHTGLSPNTAYYYKIWAYAEDDSTKSDGSATKPYGDSPQTADATTELGAPTVISITPSSGTNDGTVDITDLAGTNFVAGATVKLTKTGESDINATSVVVVSPTQITCTFDLTGAATSTWDVVVTTAGGSDTLTNGFTITLPAAALRINEVAPSESSSKDWIEFYVATAGDYHGYIVREGAISVKTFPAEWTSLSAGDYIVLHFENSTTDETTTDTNGNGYWDIYDNTTGGLTATDNVITISNAADTTIVDAMCFANQDEPPNWTGNDTWANNAISAGQWTATNPPPSEDFEADCADNSSAGAGKSLGRDSSSTDTDASGTAKNDWQRFTIMTPGEANVTISPNAGNLLINEVSFNDGTNDWVELYVVDGSVDWTNYVLVEDISTVATIPAAIGAGVETGDYIVIHEEAGTDDTIKSDNNSGYWDMYEAGSFYSTDDIIQIKDSLGRRVDAVLYSNNDGPSGWTRDNDEAQEVVTDGLWDATADFTVAGGDDDSDAWTDSGDVGTDETIGRDSSSTDTNAKGDWSLFTTQTMGSANTAGGTAGGGEEYEGYSGCFIASAAYGGYTDDHRFITDGHRSQITTLQNFRDEYLLTNAPGRAFVRFYYRHSPGAAAFISRHEPLRAITRFSLKPIVWLTRRVVNDEL